MIKANDLLTMEDDYLFLTNTLIKETESHIAYMIKFETKDYENLRKILTLLINTALNLEPYEYTISIEEKLIPTGKDLKIVIKETGDTVLHLLNAKGQVIIA